MQLSERRQRQGRVKPVPEHPSPQRTGTHGSHSQAYLPRQNMAYASAAYCPIPNSSVGSRHCEGGQPVASRLGRCREAQQHELQQGRRQQGACCSF